MHKLVRLTTACIAAVTLAACGSGSTSGSATATSTPGQSSSSATTSPSKSSSASSSSSAGSSSSESSTSATTSSSSASSGTGAGGVDPVAAELLAKIIAATSSVTSLRGNLAINAPAASGGAQTATFDEKLENGTASALKMNFNAGTTALDVLYVDNKLFMGGAIATQFGGGKPWVELSENTTDPTLKQLYSQFQTTVDSSGPQQYLDFLQLASNTQKVGSEQVNGVDTEKYTLDLDLANLESAQISANTKTSMEALVKAGVTTVPCTFWVDDQGLMQQVQQDIEVQGQKISTTIGFTNYNEPVDIVAPDPATVATP